MIHLGDITQLHGDEITVVDIITGGSPCQDLSVAGKRAGLDGERSGLFMEQIRIVKEMRERDRRNGRSGWFIRPRFMVWENVPGAFSSSKGRDFQAVLTEIVKIAEPDAPDVPMPENGKWSKAGCLYQNMGGWSVAWRVHDAQFWGVPQRRKRIALVADFGGLSAPEILFEREGLSRDIEPCGTAREGTAAETQSGVDPAICLQGNGINRADTAGCNGKGWREDQCYTRNTIDRPAVCAGFKHKASWTAGGIGYEEEKAPSLICGQESAVYDAREPLCVEMTSTKNTVVEEGISPTLTKEREVVATFQNTGRGWWNESDVAATLRTPCGGDSTKANLCRIASVVRRLTPTECERLQGFPDGWTDIGEWTDSKGRLHKEADSPRYKALGNSIALPFWEYLARRICALYERPATMGSLFDGIGGFPLAFERAGAKAVWASEIEEFPIAVTKLHFPEERSIE